MLNTIVSLFGRSPFAPLQSHMDKVSMCVHCLKELFEALEKQDYVRIESLAAQISDLEHQADLTKNDIRNHLPKGLFMPIDRSNLLEILSIQDRIADTAEDVAVLITLKPLVILEHFREDFHQFLHKNIEAVDAAHLIIKEINGLVETSFGGIEAQKVRAMVDHVSYKEHEVDLVQRKLLKDLFRSESEMSYGTFFLWQRIFQATAALSNLSENLANRVRLTLEIK
ncbi:MAG: TIGR00153 family protein [Parachlamydiaceae bacterium]|nr:TIGR00153 family protein [Parachlamydiaceae bacterium]